MLLFGSLSMTVSVVDCQIYVRKLVKIQIQKLWVHSDAVFDAKLILLVPRMGIQNLCSSWQLSTGPHQSSRPPFICHLCQANGTCSAIHQQYPILGTDRQSLLDLAKASSWCPDRCKCISSYNSNLHPSHGHGKDCQAKWRNTIRADAGNFRNCWSSQDSNGQISQGSPYTWISRELSTLCQSCGETWLARREIRDAGTRFGPQVFFLKWWTCFVYVCKLQCAYLQPS